VGAPVSVIQQPAPNQLKLISANEIFVSCSESLRHGPWFGINGNHAISTRGKSVPCIRENAHRGMLSSTVCAA
ncbi:hypothetical protein, partial [Pseudomonas gingeri]|uniref:hypothetical protein n=1 Tax=Pseudomonas gingeri TaxID=117681 RepID=UPI001ADFBBE8